MAMVEGMRAQLLGELTVRLPPTHYQPFCMRAQLLGELTVRLISHTVPNSPASHLQPWSIHYNCVSICTKYIYVNSPVI